MRNIITCLLSVGLTAGLAGCSGLGPSNDVASIDIARITANWPKFINYNNQLTADAQAIERSNDPDSVKRQNRERLRQRYVALQEEVTNNVRDAAAQVASERHIKLIVTSEVVGYGGVDITPDVEKVLKITEASPAAQ